LFPLTGVEPTWDDFDGGRAVAEFRRLGAVMRAAAAEDERRMIRDDLLKLLEDAIAKSVRKK
jgi:hypothetical protein